MKIPGPATLVATVFGIGHIGAAPGTLASAVALPLAIPIALFAGGGMGLLGAALLAFAVGIPACADHMRLTGREDPSECVIDEVAGQWLACAFCLLDFGAGGGHVSLPAFALAFALFRLFDIWKPGPVGWADRNLGGGLGVMADDMLAGLLAGILVTLARYFFNL